MNEQNYLKRLQEDLKSQLKEIEGKNSSEELQQRAVTIIRDCIERIQNELWRSEYGI